MTFTFLNGPFDFNDFNKKNIWKNFWDCLLILTLTSIVSTSVESFIPKSRYFDKEKSKSFLPIKELLESVLIFDW